MFSLNTFNNASSFSYGTTALTTTAKELGSAHSTYGLAYLPDANWTENGNSFMIRPFEIEVVQNPGGDGVDLEQVCVCMYVCMYVCT